tara:strand:- start:485 stop:1594 length:1110 start_codon:yes stop_codon:yes gene_type:complete
VQSRKKNSDNFNISELENFRQSFPWIGGDLQTIRDTFCLDFKLAKKVEKVFIPVENLISDDSKKDYLLCFLEFPENNQVKGLVVVTHGLGGSTRRFGLRRIAKKLLNDGFIICKLNLRGAGSGRYLTKSNYSARCSKDIFSVIDFLRNKFKREINDFNLSRQCFPIFGIGLSLGGTIFLNACLDYESKNRKSLFDGLACISSPLDLLTCSACIDKPRNFLYQKWLIRRLKKQVLDIKFNKDISYQELVKDKIKKVKTIREFDEQLTAPSWGYKSVDDYYLKASPLMQIKSNSEKLPLSLFIHAKDDPWVPYEATHKLSKLFNKSEKISFLITEKGGHNGFHSPKGCWSDEIVRKWIISSCNILKRIQNN